MPYITLIPVQFKVQVTGEFSTGPISLENRSRRERSRRLPCIVLLCKTMEATRSARPPRWTLDAPATIPGTRPHPH